MVCQASTSASIACALITNLKRAASQSGSLGKEPALAARGQESLRLLREVLGIRSLVEMILHRNGFEVTLV